MSGVGGDPSTVLVDVDELEPRGDDLNVDELLTNTGPTTLKPGKPFIYVPTVSTFLFVSIDSYR